MKEQLALHKFWYALVFAFLYLPIVVVIAFSFNDSAISILPIRGLTLNAYSSLAGDAGFKTAVGNTLYVTAATVPLTVILGTSAAIGITKLPKRWQVPLTAVFLSPMVVPHIVMAIALLAIFSSLGVQLSLLTVIASHVLITLPFVVLIIGARMLNIDPSLEEAAMDMGASRLRYYGLVLIPALAPAILGAGLITATLSIDEIMLTLFTTGNDNTIPMLIWGKLRTGITPDVNALASIVIIASLAVAGAAQALTGHLTGKSRRKT